MVIENETQDCEGCATHYKVGGHTCSYSKSDPFYHVCPCTICIVKSMCTRTCEAYIMFQKQLKIDRRGPSYGD